MESLDASSDGSLLSSEKFKYKTLLHDHAQRSSLPKPVYQSVNLGDPHAPHFKASVSVGGETFESSSTFTHRKEAEHDVARIAFESVSQSLKANGVSFVQNDTVFCKSILHEYAVKMNIEQPIYTSVESKGYFPTFITSVAFDGETYTGSIGRTKKASEQIASRAVIESILASGTGNTMPQIIKSKGRFNGAIGNGHGSCMVQDVGLSGNGNNFNGDIIAKAKAMISTVANESLIDISKAEPLSSGQHAEDLTESPIPFELKTSKQEVPDLPKLGGNDECPVTLQQSDPTVANDSRIGSSKTRKRQDKRNRARAKRARADGESVYPETVAQGALPKDAEAIGKKIEN